MLRLYVFCSKLERHLQGLALELETWNIPAEGTLQSCTWHSPDHTRKRRWIESMDNYNRSNGSRGEGGQDGKQGCFWWCGLKLVTYCPFVIGRLFSVARPWPTVKSGNCGKSPRSCWKSQRRHWWSVGWKHGCASELPDHGRSYFCTVCLGVFYPFSCISDTRLCTQCTIYLWVVPCNYHSKVSFCLTAVGKTSSVLDRHHPALERKVWYIDICIWKVNHDV